MPQTGSTNADLLEQARAGAAEGLVLVAEEQTAGRGRLGRTWSAPPGAGLIFSVLLRPADVPPTRLGWLPLLTGVAVAAAVRDAGRRAGQPQMAERRAGGGAEAGRDPGRGAWRRGRDRRRAERHAEPARAAGADRDLAADRGRGQHRPGRAAGRDPGRTGPPVPGLAHRPGRAATCARTTCAGARRSAGRSAPNCPAARCSPVPPTDVDDAGRLVLRTPGGLVPVGAGDVVHVR